MYGCCVQRCHKMQEPKESAAGAADRKLHRRNTIQSDNGHTEPVQMRNVNRSQSARSRPSDRTPQHPY
eukprot:jgi/Tetstr1/462397/TSEL_007403.t1